MTCWIEHERCALVSARDLMENRAEQARARAKAFRDGVERLDRLEPLPVAPEVVEAARRLLREYHAALRAGREK